MNREDYFIFKPSYQFNDAFKALPYTSLTTAQFIMSLVKSGEIGLTAGVYLHDLPNKTLIPIHIGYQYFDKYIREIIKIERMQNGIVVVTNKEIKTELNEKDK